MMAANLTRRELLAWMAAGTGVAAAGATAITSRGGSSSPPSTAAPEASDGAPPTPTDGSAPAAPPAAPTGGPVSAIADVNQRLLVVIEMPGGNDGLSTAVPYGMAGYYDLRSQTAIAAEDALRIDDEIGLHPNLVNIHRRGVTLVHGIGSSRPDGSHFEMMSRWWAGDAIDASRYDTGWIGRLADVIGDPAAPATAISIGSGSHPIIRARKASTLALPSADAAGYLAGAAPDDVVAAAFQRGARELAAVGESGEPYLDRIRQTIATSIAFADHLVELDEGDDGDSGYPSGELAERLAFTRRLLGLESGIRIVHVSMSGDFDTHENHNGRHPELMSELDAAVSAFLDDIAAHGLAERTLVMTTSEFGRTAAENGSAGLDHGTASTHLLLGPVNAGRYGEHPSLSDRDDNDDLIATMELEQYLGTVVEGWFGVPAGDVFDSSPEVLSGLFA
jgi:uncharacterized protein (DUF1501 family)